MRILMVSEDLPGERIGGLGKHVVTLANALVESGHFVDILGRAEDVNHASARQIGFRGRVLPGFGFTHLGWKELQLGFFNPYKRPFFAHRIARAIERHGGDYDVVHYHGHLPLAGRYVDPQLNFVQTRHDQGSECVIHLRIKDGHPCATVRAADCAGCIHRAPGALRSALSGHAVERYRRLTADAFARHKTIFVSDFLRQAFLRAVPDADLRRSRVIHNFISYPNLKAQAESAGPVRRGVALLVGRIDAGKGFGEFLAAAAGRLPPGAQVTIIGDGPERAALEQRYGNEQVRFLGWRPNDEVIRRSAEAHVCVVPSVCEEPCATTILEALALGKPCVALAHGGSAELAAYQYYEGQLQLAQDMPRLVGLLAGLLQTDPVEPSLPDAFPMDVYHAIPKILDCYAD
ncbi:hypothetical protein GCM10027321_47440 [Massilia terrae]|uniref:Glycosyltransferase family 4 protein n=1 Tax=Massilia terrae TaxID=1811224 RepID=A0ABT2CYH9_9BURK|nr:glycosyltransferase family 4 protein [Massilia terrae]MCS0659036.1 glycosyltransferase family 4 protein [Massilia terrae]